MGFIRKGGGIGGGALPANQSLTTGIRKGRGTKPMPVRRKTAGSPATVPPNCSLSTTKHIEGELAGDIDHMPTKHSAKREQHVLGSRGSVMAGQPTHEQAFNTENNLMEIDRPKPVIKYESRASVAGKLSPYIETTRGKRITEKAKGGHEEALRQMEGAAGFPSADVRLTGHIDDIDRTDRAGPVGSDTRAWDPDAAGVASCMSPRCDTLPVAKRAENGQTASRMCLGEPPATPYERGEGGKKMVDPEAVLLDVDAEYGIRAGTMSRKIPKSRMISSPKSTEGCAGLASTRRNDQRHKYRLSQKTRVARNQLETLLQQGIVPEEIPAGVQTECVHGCIEQAGITKHPMSKVDTTERVFGGEKYRPDPPFIDYLDTSSGTKFVGLVQPQFKPNIQRKNPNEEGERPAGSTTFECHAYIDTERSRGKCVSGQMKKTFGRDFMKSTQETDTFDGGRKKRANAVRPMIDRKGNVVAGKPSLPLDRGDFERRLGEPAGILRAHHCPAPLPQFTPSPRYGQISHVHCLGGGG